MPDETRSSTPEDSAPDAETRWVAPAERVEVKAGSHAPQALPAMIGHYRVRRLLAEGGMGAVYEAEQEHPHRLVALKLIKGGFATPELRRRFEQEAQALGRLQHPGIAQIYEAGNVETELGPQPYLAMELIAGQPLVEYARGLDVHRRIELVARVCDAVHHAHQRGIIHRDLKPANILVDSQGQSKILDFGIAQVADADPQATRQTRAGQLVGTFAYMSPEQIAGDPYEIDTRSDVYALGVILYEVLAGRLPIDVAQKSFLDTVQAIREQEAASLSSVSRMYRGDIETIVAKALDKDKTRRYASASDLAADLRRYLNYEPILARPASTIYQVRKFARRNRTLVAGVAAVFVVLIAGIAASSWESLRARSAERAARQAESHATQERDRAITAEAEASSARDRAVTAEHNAISERDRAVAESRRADSEAATAKAINDFLQNDMLAQASALGQAGSNAKPDPDIKVRTVLDRAAERLAGQFKTEPKVGASIEYTIGQTYWRLGLYAPAQQHLQRAVALDQQSLGPNNPATLAAAESLGEVYRSAGKYPEAEALLRETLQFLQRTRKPSDDARLKAERALGGIYMAEGKLPAAEPLLAEAIKNGAPDGESTLEAMGLLARIYFVRGQSADAERVLKALIASYTKQFGPDDPRTTGRMNNLAVLYQRDARFGDAEAIYDNVLAAERRTNGPDHPETLNVMNNLGVLYVAEGKYKEAEPLYGAVLANWRQTLGPEHPRTLSLLSNQAAMLQGEGKLAEAEAQYAKVLEVRMRVLGGEHTDTLDSMHLLAWVYRLEGKYAEAEPLLQKTLETRRRVLGPRNAETIASLAEVGELRLLQGRYAEAQKALQEALEQQMQVKPTDYRRYRFESALGASLAGQQSYSEAEPLLISGYEGMRERQHTVTALNWPQVREAGERLVRLYEAWGKPEQAAERRKQMAAVGQF